MYSMIENDVTLVQYGSLTFGIGMSFETFMGKSDQHGDTAFNVYGGHWKIRGTFGLEHRDMLYTLFTDHECFHNIDMADTCGQYMNNLKIGVENLMDRVPASGFMPTGWVPDYFASAGIYRPATPAFQKGHTFDWSLHGYADMPVYAEGSMVLGTIFLSDLYFHRGGSGSARHYAELYARHRGSSGDIVMFLRHHIHDTQPIRPIEGKTCFGLRFQW